MTLGKEVLIRYLRRRWQKLKKVIDKVIYCRGFKLFDEEL